MNHNDKNIVNKTDQLPEGTTPEGYERLMRLMNPDHGKADIKVDQQQEHRMWMYFAIGIAVFTLLAFVLLGEGHSSTANDKAGIEKNINTYIKETYMDNLDKFDKNDYLTIYSEENMLFTTERAYGLYLQSPQWGYQGFSIIADPDGNIIYDGYQQWYLKGGVTFDYYNSLYNNQGHEAKEELYSNGRNNGIFSLTDIVNVSCQLINQQEYNGFGKVMIDPILEPEKQYDLCELADKYGRISVTIKSYYDEPEDFVRFAEYIREYVNSAGIRYNTTYIQLIPHNITNIRNYNATFTPSELANADFGRIAIAKMETYTTKEYNQYVDQMNKAAEITMREQIKEFLISLID